MKNNVYIVKQVAKYLSKRTVIRLIHNKKIIFSKVEYAGKIQEKDINEYLNTYINYAKEA